MFSVCTEGLASSSLASCLEACHRACVSCPWLKLQVSDLPCVELHAIMEHCLWELDECLTRDYWWACVFGRLMSAKHFICSSVSTHYTGKSFSQTKLSLPLWFNMVPQFAFSSLHWTLFFLLFHLMLVHFHLTRPSEYSRPLRSIMTQVHKARLLW